MMGLWVGGVVLPFVLRQFLLQRFYSSLVALCDDFQLTDVIFNFFKVKILQKNKSILKGNKKKKGKTKRAK